MGISKPCFVGGFGLEKTKARQISHDINQKKDQINHECSGCWVLGKLGPGQLGPGQLGPGQLGPGAQLSGAQFAGAQLSGAQFA